MAKKFTLSVPDGLAQKIEARRDYLGNLSALFQEAVEEKIRKREDFEKRLDEDESIEKIIERLRQERLEIEGNFGEQGRLAGLAWAKAASYGELQHALAFDPDAEGLPWHGPEERYHNVVFENKVLGGYFKEILKSNPPLSPPAEGSKLLDFLPRYWMKGWCEAVREFWRAVEKKL